MSGTDADLQPTDLFLLATHLAQPDVCTQRSLEKLVGSLTGAARLEGADGERRRLGDVISDWQLTAIREGLLATTASMQCAVSNEPPVEVTPAGLERLREQFGAPLLQKTWRANGDRYLVARALGLPPSAGPQRLKRLDTAAGLRLAVVRRGWALKIPESATIAQVRTALASRALGDAFGKPVERQIGLNHRMSGKAARAIAAQLLKKKRRISSDTQLINALAAQHLGTATGDGKSLRQALIRKLFGFAKKEQSRVDTATLDESETHPQRRMDSTAFLRAVRNSAKLNANGWSGNRKAYISHVWRTICDSHPDWRLSSDTFKAMLADAHRLGDIVLINADLRDRANMRDIQDSAVQYQNMEWHYVQIAD